MREERGVYGMTLGPVGSGAATREFCGGARVLDFKSTFDELGCDSKEEVWIFRKRRLRRFYGVFLEVIGDWRFPAIFRLKIRRPWLRFEISHGAGWKGEVERSSWCENGVIWLAGTAVGRFPVGGGRRLTVADLFVSVRDDEVRGGVGARSDIFM